MGYALDLLSEVFQAQGMAPDKARKTAEVALAVQVAAGITTAKVIEAVDRDEHVYKLRGMRMTGMEPMTVSVISTRVGLVPSKVFQAIRKHGERRRAVLRLIA